MKENRYTKTIIEFELTKQDLIEAICFYLEDKGKFTPVDCVEALELDEEENDAIIQFVYKDRK